MDFWRTPASGLGLSVSLSATPQGFGLPSEPAALSIWVNDNDVGAQENPSINGHETARRQPREDSLNDGDDAVEEASYVTSRSPTGPLLRVGFWMIGGFGIVFLLTMFVVELYKFSRALLLGNPAEGSGVSAFLIGVFTWFSGLLLKQAALGVKTVS